MLTKHYAALAASVVALLSTSCIEATLPRFDGGLLNPEIRFLRAGEIMEGVKCAMVAFMHEREKMLMRRRETGDSRDRARTIEKDDFAVYQLHTKQLRKQLGRIYPAAFVSKCGRGEHLGYNFAKPKGGERDVICLPNNCGRALEDPALELGESVWDHDLVWTGNSVKEKGCAPVPDYSRFALDPNQSASVQLTLTGINSGFIHYQRIDALRTPLYPFIQPGNPAAGAPFPTLFVNPKQTTVFDISGVMPQSIHTYRQTAHPSDVVPSVQTEMTTLLQEAEKAPKILKDTKKPEESELTQILRSIEKQKAQLLAQKQRIEGTEYSYECGGQKNAKGKRGKNADPEEGASLRKGMQLLLVAAQTSCARAKALVYNDPGGSFAAKLEDVKSACEETYKGAKDTKFFDVMTRFLAQIPDEPKACGRQQNEFLQQCRIDLWSYNPDDLTRIDFRALKKVLNKVIEEQEGAIYSGVPDITLNALTLTSTFQIVLEASAGTKYLFRIVPLLAPPNTDIKADHTHNLKVVLNGKKNKGDKSLSKKLYESCRERVVADTVRPTVRGDEPVDFCASEPGQLLEAIVQALEKGGSSGSSGQ